MIENNTYNLVLKPNTQINPLNPNPSTYSAKITFNLPDSQQFRIFIITISSHIVINYVYWKSMKTLESAGI